eukprot:6489171-Amphidinium_carterae.1
MPHVEEAVSSANYSLPIVDVGCLVLLEASPKTPARPKCLVVQDHVRLKLLAVAVNLIRLTEESAEDNGKQKHDSSSQRITQQSLLQNMPSRML